MEVSAPKSGSLVLNSTELAITLCSRLKTRISVSIGMRVEKTRCISSAIGLDLVLGVEPVEVDLLCILAMIYSEEVQLKQSALIMTFYQAQPTLSALTLRSGDSSDTQVNNPSI